MVISSMNVAPDIAILASRSHRRTSRSAVRAGGIRFDMTNEEAAQRGYDSSASTYATVFPRDLP